MRILGIDPGYAIVGYGVIDRDSRGNCTVVDYGAINTPKDEDFPVRLAMIQDGVSELMEHYKPDAVAVEELFFNQNITTGIAVAEARGVILCTAIKTVPKEATKLEMRILPTWTRALSVPLVKPMRRTRFIILKFNRNFKRFSKCTGRDFLWVMNMPMTKNTIRLKVVEIAAPATPK